MVKIFKFVTKLTRTKHGYNHKAQVLEPIPLKKGVMKRGVESGFLVDINGHGVKTFYSESDARYSAKKQQLAYKFKAAPKVLSEVFPVIVSSWARELKTSSLIYKWAYETEVATMGDEYSSEEEAILQKKFNKAKISTTDMHSDNIGRINGVLVGVDFGRISTDGERD